MDQNNRDNKDRNIDWSRFGLGSETAQRVRANTSGFVDLSNDYGAGGHQASGANELFAEEQGDVPWWKSNFFISQPVLFGTWDGVFTSCLINIFGVIVFLRSGWIVGQAGVISAVLIVLATVFIALISVLSAVGICERCRIESGGVYFVIAHVLGSRFGGSLGLLYCFGQAVGCALNVLGFGESMAELIGFGDSKIAVRVIAGAAVLLLSVINVAGVKWVIKLQFILLLILLLAGLDFMVGSFVHTDVENGFDGWLGGNLHENLWSSYKDGYSWFTVFGVFFPTITGILSGINMSGDLKAPSTNIPNGSLAAISTGTFLYLVFVVFLGATCHRDVLLTDFMIAAKVSAIRVLLLAGLYVSSMSSCLGAMYGTPRVLQSIALENVIPGISILGMGRGPNKVPLYSMAVVAIVTLTFIMIGEINTLAPIVTMPYLLTYACIDYSYFALAQTFDIQHQREQRFDRPKIHQTFSVETDDDLDRLFPERTRHKTLRGESNSGSPSSPDDNIETTPIAPKTHIHSKPKNWYSNLCNRWFSLFGAALKIIIMFLVNWVYAIACISAVFLVWLYIGTANPAVKPGLASEFRFFRWLKTVILRCMGKRVYDYEQIVVTPVHPGLDVTSSQLNEDNEDFSNRRRYHQSATVHGHMVAIDD
ncbi:solute carrier family 12 member 8 [Tribolium madens]|uniref:solute carrier family 12 member 8 n=1 Tax=Tribolium madens TaxID=41895 RepID=UPI001CF729EC|nr:solute carrier family 12 member 8 [Tribolium madens]